MLRINKLFAGVAAFVAFASVLSSCGSKKALIGGSTAKTGVEVSSRSNETIKLDFLRRVYDNEAYANCISSKIKFTIHRGSKDFSVSGSLRMKKDDVIRIQLTPFGLMEAGRIEFTKDYVLIMDRLNKEYVKAGYAEVDFLRRNGLDFYSLQALFRNSLFLPGTQKLTDSSLKSFDVAFGNGDGSNTVKLQRGNMSYAWKTDSKTGRIGEVAVTYDGKSSGKTTVTCTYYSFKPLGTKMFPAEMTLKMNSSLLKKAEGVSVSISSGSFDTSDDWETRTEVSAKYKKVSVDDVMKRILSL